MRDAGRAGSAAGGGASGVNGCSRLIEQPGSRVLSLTTDDDSAEPQIHFYYKISLRIMHPNLDPQVITDTLLIVPRIASQAGVLRSTSEGRLLGGVHAQSFWTAELARGEYPPSTLNNAVHEALDALSRHRAFLHKVRLEGGRSELFIGWFFNEQSGDELLWPMMALVGDLMVDLSLNIYR